MTDKLKNILKRCDAQSGAPDAGDDELVASSMAMAEQRLRRRTTLRLGGTALVALVLLVGTQSLLVNDVPVTTVARSGGDSSERAAMDPDQTAREALTSLDRKLATTTAVLARLEQRERLRRRPTIRRVSVSSSPVFERDISMESAAQTLLLQGDRLAGDALTQQLAPDVYRRILELFPLSAAAEDARERLAETLKGESV